MDWRNQAACLTQDPELFFSVGTSRPALKRVAEAKKVCAPCPVRLECLQWSVDIGAENGVWGGLGESERRALRRRIRLRDRAA